MEDGRVLPAGASRDHGGKVKDGETPLAAAIRELEEECGLVAQEKDVRQVAFVHFFFEESHVFDCYVYLAGSWQKEPVESDEMRPQWFKLSDIPYDNMWEADRKWIPKILANEKIEALVRFDKEGKVVKEFSTKPAVFD